MNLDYSKKLFPYIKPTRKLHETGFRIFEVGYVDAEDKKHVVLGRCSDSEI